MLYYCIISCYIYYITLTDLLYLNSKSVNIILGLESFKNISFGVQFNNNFLLKF